jgi:hypothetical protein
MPFGLTNTLVVFQQKMNDILWEYLDHFVVIYLDDILIYSKNEEEHKHHVRLVLKFFTRMRTLCQPGEIPFPSIDCRMLDYIILGDGISMDVKTIQIIVDWIAPSSIWDVQCLLGFTNFYRIFIKDYSKIDAPLTCLTGKNKFV